MTNLTNDQTDLIEEIFAGYHLDFITAEEALEDIESVLGLQPTPKGVGHPGKAPLRRLLKTSRNKCPTPNV